MDRRAFLAGSAAFLATPLADAAPPAGKVHRIGYVGYVACSEDLLLRGPFRQGLRELGYVEGLNIVTECRSPAGTAERNADLLAELVRLNVDVLVTTGTKMTLAAKQVTSKVPIVMVYVGDPIASGIVTRLERPEANLTGISMPAPEMVQKGLELLKEAVPTVSRIAVLMDSTNPGQTLLDDRMTATAKTLGLTLQRVTLRTSADLDTALATVLKQRADALFVHPLPLTPRDSERLAAFGVQNRLPTMATFQWVAKTGLLMSYVPDVAKQFRRVGIYIDKILRGANPSDLPIEPADTFKLWVNLKTAKALNLAIPMSLLLRADGWIE